ncbi:MAG: hypothetical protein JRF54_06055 [Deltaproteobacteria bacterium]|nr:hypothetical protein [Deltaproteobacteria bacterium]
MDPTPHAIDVLGNLDGFRVRYKAKVEGQVFRLFQEAQAGRHLARLGQCVATQIESEEPPVRETRFDCSRQCTARKAPTSVHPAFEVADEPKPLIGEESTAGIDRANSGEVLPGPSHGFFVHPRVTGPRAEEESHGHGFCFGTTVIGDYQSARDLRLVEPPRKGQGANNKRVQQTAPCVGGRSENALVTSLVEKVLELGASHHGQ